MLEREKVGIDLMRRIAYMKRAQEPAHGTVIRTDIITLLSMHSFWLWLSFDVAVFVVGVVWLYIVGALLFLVGFARLNCVEI